MSIKSFLLSLIPRRTVIVYRDIIHVGPTFQSWEGEDGTYFKLEPLARTKDSREFLIAAYPAGYYENGWMPIYKRLEYSAMYINSIGTDKFDAEVAAQVRSFTRYYYDLPIEERQKVDERWRGPGVWALSY